MTPRIDRRTEALDEQDGGGAVRMSGSVPVATRMPPARAVDCWNSR
ncbi:hypothetical protein [Streptomyces sp. MN13]